MVNTDVTVEMAAETTPVIELVEASRVYPGVTPIVALRPTDLIVQRGDAVAITGRSGSGKSTLLQLLGLLDRPTDGQYWLNGVDTAVMADRQRTRLRGSHIGFVFQSFHLIAHRSAEENVRLGLMYRGVPPAQRRLRAIEALHRVGLADRCDALPGELSGGQRQRVAIARALAIEPAVLLADEPTGNLDTHTADDVLELFDAIHRGGQTIVVVTHDREVAARMPRRLTITDGVVTEEAPARSSVWRDLWSEALAGVLARPARTALTALGTVLGTATLVITTGLADTAGAQIVSRFDALAATTVTVIPTPQDGPQAMQSVIPWDASARLERLNGVNAAATMTTMELPDSTVTATSVVDPLAAKGASATIVAGSPELAGAVRAKVTGRFFDVGHDSRGDRVAVIGKNLANTLHLADLRQRPAVFVGNRAFTVIGVLVETSRAATLLDSVIMPEGAARTAFGLRAPTSVVVDTAIGAAGLIAAQAPVALAPQKPELLTAERPPEPTATRAKVAEDVRALFVLLGLISLVVGGVGIANTTLVSVLERIGEIGLRRSLGGTRASVACLFILESSVIGLIGGVLGSSVGVLAVVAVGAVKQWTPVLDLWVTPAAVVVGAVVGLLAGLYPSLRAAKVEPIAALRAQA